jgi:hypothetical protein
LSEHVAQAQENKHCQRQEDNRINVHVVSAFWSRPALGPVTVRSRFLRNSQDYIIDSSPQDVGTKSCPANGTFRRSQSLARFCGPGKVRTWGGNRACSTIYSTPVPARPALAKRPRTTNPPAAVRLWNEARLC